MLFYLLSCYTVFSLYNISLKAVKKDRKQEKENKKQNAEKEMREKEKETRGKGEIFGEGGGTEKERGEIKS